MSSTSSNEYKKRDLNLDVGFERFEEDFHADPNTMFIVPNESKDKPIKNRVLRSDNMKNEILQVIGRECKVFELQLPCECGGYFTADINNAISGKYIDGEYYVLHACNKCNKSIQLQDVYPKHSFRPYGEFIRFGELSGVRGSPSDEDNKQE